MAELIFVDTWGFVVSVDRRDQWRPRALACIDDLARREVPLVTTNAVLYETYGMVRGRCSHREAVALIDWIAGAVAGAVLSVVWVTPALEAAAESIFRRYADKDFSFVDCLSFAVMQQLGITTAFTGDEHFGQMGFETIPRL